MIDELESIKLVSRLRALSLGSEVRVYDAKTKVLKRIEDADGNVVRVLDIPVKKPIQHRPKYRVVALRFGDSDLFKLQSDGTYKRDYGWAEWKRDFVLWKKQVLKHEVENKRFIEKINKRAFRKGLVWNEEKQTYEPADVNGMLTYLYTKVSKLEKQLAKKQGRKVTRSYENVENDVNILLTEDDMARHCLRCDSLKMINGMLRCKLQTCKYGLRISN